MNSKKIIKIELQSDLCVGSGYSYAGIVDNDICYDDCGIPYIPSKRLKGCMRETLEMLGKVGYPGNVDALFGKAGASDYESEKDTKIRVGNAYIEEYESLHAMLKKNIDRGEINAQDILERFTHVVAQTAMENGVSNDQTLRYTRVVNRYYPFAEGTSKPLVFNAEITLNNSDEEVVKDTLTAMTHIGLKRNRGFGLVKCTLEEKKETDTERDSMLLVDASKKRISFALMNVEPLMLSGMKEDVSTDYISAQSLIGLLAGRYLAKSGNSAEEPEFQDLFINGKTKYTNLYPCKDGAIHYPAPDYLEKLKKNGRVVFHLEDTLPDRENIAPDFDYGNGNLPKKLKGKYVARDGCEVSLLEVTKEISYHHRQDENRILYSSTAVSPGQFFAGSVETSDDKCLQLLKELLLDGDFYFGKSRTAQYGLCRLADASNMKEASSDDLIPAGNKILVTFLSDAVFLSEAGEYTVYSDEVEERVKEELGLSDPVSASYQTTMITGFYGKWNLRKAPVPAIRAGSFMLFENKEDYKPAKYLVGEKTVEGLGRIRIENADALRYDGVALKNTTQVQPTEEKKVVCDSAIDVVFPILAKRWIEEKINEYIEKDSFRLFSSNASVGRMKLMLMESIHDPQPLDSFTKRIKSIKNEGTRKEGEKLVKAAQDFMKAANQKYADLVTAPVGMDIGLPQVESPKGKALCEYMQNKWTDYVMGIITIRKYTGGGK